MLSHVLGGLPTVGSGNSVSSMDSWDCGLGVGRVRGREGVGVVEGCLLVGTLVVVVKRDLETPTSGLQHSTIVRKNFCCQFFNDVSRFFLL